MKGHVCIELHNHNSGFTERIEQDNMVTNALTYAMGHAVSCGANLSDLMLPACKRGLGGLFLKRNLERSGLLAARERIS